MKKIMMLILILLFAVPAFGTTINLTAASSKDVISSGDVRIVTFTSTSSVTTGVTQVFALAIPFSRGWIDGASFQSTSANCDLWLSFSDGETGDSTESPIWWTDINLSAKPEMLPIEFTNMDTSVEYKLYLSIYNPDTTATGTWSFSITLRSNQR